MSILLGTKIGMTRVFDETGRAVAVTAVKVNPCVVTQIKTVEHDGYAAVQVGTGAARHPKQPQAGHAKRAGFDITPQALREFPLAEGLEVGQTLDCTSFTIGDLLRMTATSKGKGFAGVIKKHHFHRGPQTHGSDHHRAPGSIGSMYPQHVLKGKKMPGKMGNDQITVRKVKVIDILPEQGVILVKGPVPGIPGGLVELARM